MQFFACTTLVFFSLFTFGTNMVMSDLLSFLFHYYFCNDTLTQEDAIINHFIHANKKLLGRLHIKLAEMMEQNSTIHSSIFSHFLLAKL